MSTQLINAHFFPLTKDCSSFQVHDVKSQEDWILSLKKGDKVLLYSGQAHSNSTTFDYALVDRITKTLIVFKAESKGVEYKFKTSKMSFKGGAWDASIVEVYPVGKASNSLIASLNIARGLRAKISKLQTALSSSNNIDIIAMAMDDENFAKEMELLTKKAEALTLKYFPQKGE